MHLLHSLLQLKPRDARRPQAGMKVREDSIGAVAQVSAPAARTPSLAEREERVLVPLVA